MFVLVGNFWTPEVSQSLLQPVGWSWYFFVIVLSAVWDEYAYMAYRPAEVSCVTLISNLNKFLQYDKTNSPANSWQSYDFTAFYSYSSKAGYSCSFQCTPAPAPLEPNFKF